MDYQKYKNEYDKVHYTLIPIRLRKDKDADIIEFLKTKEPRNEYLKALLRKEMNK